MPRLPVVSGDEFARTMQKLGYTVDRMRGSHMILRCPGRSLLSVPRHRELDRGTLRGLIRDAGLSVEDFVELVKQP